MTEPTPKELVMREMCVTLSAGHVRTMHKHMIPCTAEAIFQYVSRFQTLYWHIIERKDGKLSGDGWQ